jgi:hypothetical protein
MTTTFISKQDKVIRYLTKGKTLSQDSAYNMFEVGNLRATMSDIKPIVTKQGYNIIRKAGRGGETRYGLVRRTTKSRR